MKKDYIEIGGKQYRVEVNWNALAAFLVAVGRDTIEDLAGFNTIKPSEVAALIWACVSEGERLEGRGFNLSVLDIGAVISPVDVTTFMEIYIRQSSPQMEVDEPKKEEGQEAPTS